MDPDHLKPAWRAQPQPAIDPEWLLAEVRRNHGWFAATIFWRDVREVGVSLLIVPLCIYLGRTQSSSWTWYLAVPASLWIAGFLLVDRRRYPQRPPDAGESLVRCVEVSLAQVEHQIWLLRNVGWWYLLPIFVAVMAFIGHVNWRTAATVWGAALATANVGAMVGLVLGGIYWLNRAAVRDLLEPRRRELQSLLTGLKDPPSQAPESPG